MNNNDEPSTAAIFNMPIGGVMPFMGSHEAMERSIADGWLPCDGKKYNKDEKKALFDAIGYAHGREGDDFNVPDLRGVFLRGVDNNEAPRDPDRNARVAAKPGGLTGNNVGTYQTDEFKAHTHTVKFWVNENKEINDPGGGIKPANVEEQRTTSAAGGSETRPRNVATHYIIFAGK